MVTGRFFGSIALFSLFLATPGWTQDQEPYDYTTEIIWGVNKNTRDGLIGGVIFKHGSSIGRDRFRTLGLELVNVKHHQEFRFNSFTGDTFIWAKENYLYSIRGQYGRDWVLFKKAPQQGVQINASLAGGPTIGLVTPYYIELQTAPGLSVTEPFDPVKHGNSFNNILGTGGIFQGLFESKVKLGLNIKTSLSFEFGTFKSNVTGFEAGFLIEAFTSEVVLVPFADNQAIFPTAFITLFYGSRR
jgi:hypothetical protein